MGAVVALALAAGLPVGAVLGHSLTRRSPCRARRRLARGHLLIVVRLSSGTRTPAARSRLVDVAAIGAGVAALIGLTSANAERPDALVLDGDRVLFALLPGLICFAAAVLAGRLLGPVMRLGERAARAHPGRVSLSAAGAGASAGADARHRRASSSSASGLALFAASYAATLAQGARDEAAYAVPLDFTLTEGTAARAPLARSAAAATTTRWRRG